MVSVRYKRVERTKIRQEAEGWKVEIEKGRFGDLMDEWNDLKNETGQSCLDWYKTLCGIRVKSTMSLASCSKIESYSLGAWNKATRAW